jgi:hypothetical protein
MIFPNQSQAAEHYYIVTDDIPDVGADFANWPVRCVYIVFTND